MNPPMSAAIEFSEAAILSRVFRPNQGDWPPMVANAIMNFGFAEDDHEHMGSLLEAAKSGTLTPDQAETLEHYRHVSKMLELMRALGFHCASSLPIEAMPRPDRILGALVRDRASGRCEYCRLPESCAAA